MSEIVVRSDSASAAQVTEHLMICDDAFIPPLSHRINIAEYATKVTRHALCIEGWHHDVLAGLICLYCNDPDRGAYITNVSVIPALQGQKIALLLMKNALEQVHGQGVGKVSLEVNNANIAALSLYQKLGFTPELNTTGTILMTMNLQREI